MLLLTLTLPITLPVAAIMTLFASTRGAVATLLFILGYLWCEVIGLLSALWIRLRCFQPDRYALANYRLQYWWASALKRLAERLFRLRFVISGEDALTDGAAIVFPRHTSIADTIIPIVFFAAPYDLQLRYVLKQELLLDPRLDIVGNRIPNLFVDRSGQDSDAARRDVAALTRSLYDGQGLVIYPEGTRHSPPKRQRLNERYRDNSEMQAQLRRWPSLLPPRLGGTMAVLAANPGRDIVFCAHHGFEGSSHFRELINGSWLNARIQLEFWRVPYSAVPKQDDQQREFMFAQWDEMQRRVHAMETAA